MNGKVCFSNVPLVAKVASEVFFFKPASSRLSTVDGEKVRWNFNNSGVSLVKFREVTLADVSTCN